MLTDPRPDAADAGATGQPAVPDEKVCTTCGLAKPVAAFSRQPNTRDGLQPRCRVCVAARQRERMREREHARQDPVRWAAYLEAQRAAQALARARVMASPAGGGLHGAAARSARATHCPQGHPYDAENTYVTPGGSRKCRACMRERTRNRERERLRQGTDDADLLAGVGALLADLLGTHPALLDGLTDAQRATLGRVREWLAARGGAPGAPDAPAGDGGGG